MTTYHEDFHAWAIEAAERMKNRNLTEADYDFIAEELEDMGKSERHAVRSELRRLLMHLLKWQYQPEKRRLGGASWKRTIRDARREIEERLDDSPSLKPFLKKILEETYLKARADAIDETGKTTPDAFPKTFADTGWTWEQVLDLDFYPE